MTELSEVEHEGDIEEVEEKPKKRVMIPEIFNYTNEDSTGSIIEIILPGVEKDTIKLKMNEDNLVIFGESEAINYGAVYQLCCAVNPEKAKSTYKNGLLKIEVPYKDMLEDIIDIKIE
ncbi:MAG: Hsp20/alpha crystallin family protein [Candidatus Hodarchaeales archaeon]|jgi:HSP20 family molecular chaperone IbpA